MIIFCQSYTEVKYTLSLIRQNPVNTVITPSQSLTKFFQFIANEYPIYNIDVIYIEPYHWKTPIQKNILAKSVYLVYDIIKGRHYLREHYKFAESMNDELVYFFSPYFNSDTYYLIKKLLEKNRVIYTKDQANDAILATPTKLNIRLFIELTAKKLLYGNDIELKSIFGNITSSMSDRFLNKCIIEKPLLNDYEKHFSFVNHNYEYIFFHDDMIEHGYTDVGFNKEIDSIFDVARESIPEDKIAIKYHPSTVITNRTLNFKNELPYQIPAELLFNDRVKIYFSVASTALAQVTKGKAISLIDLITFKDKSVKLSIKDYLEKSKRSNILFPQSLDELRKMLI